MGSRTIATRLLAPLACAAPALAQGWLCAEGGGPPTATGWGASVFGWMVEKSAHGPVVVLGVSGADAAAAQAFLALGSSSATNLAVGAGEADSPRVYRAVRDARVVWIRDGRASGYVRLWRGTLLERAIREVYASGGVVGGSGAGCAVLGEVVHDEREGAVEPVETLGDPYHPHATLTSGFLALGTGLVFDPRFTERGRLGRLATFVPRIRQDLGLDLVGVGVDDRTALCVAPDGTAEVRGEGAVTLLHRDATTHQALVPGQAPVVSSLVHTQLVEGYAYDLATRAVVARPAHARIAAPPASSAAFHATTLAGDLASDAAKGELAVDDGGDPDALFLGALQAAPGTFDLLRTVVSTLTWEDAAFDENRVGGLQWVLASNPHWLGLYLAGPVRVSTEPSGHATVEPPAGVERSLVVLDAYGVTSTATSRYVASAQSVGPRQSVAIESARLHLLREGARFAAGSHAALFANAYGVGKPSSLGWAAWLRSSGVPAPGGGFAVEVVDAVPGRLGMLLRGTASARTPFAGATLWIGGALTRLPVQALDAAGSTSYAVPVLPEQVGDQGYYQFWFRDPALADGWNVALSDALAVLYLL